MNVSFSNQTLRLRKPWETLLINLLNVTFLLDLFGSVESKRC